LKKDGIIEFLKKECIEKDKKIEALNKTLSPGNMNQEQGKKIS
jgi:hypothetical protein